MYTFMFSLLQVMYNVYKFQEPRTVDFGENILENKHLNVKIIVISLIHKMSLETVIYLMCYKLV